MMTAPPHEAHQPPPEADLIRIARLARGLSPEKAAELTHIRLGGGRWRHIERGYQMKNRPVRAPGKTLAHMAHVVGVTPERLAEVGREDAAEVLREILRQEAEAEAEQEPVYADLSDRLESAVWGMDLSLEDRKTMVDLLRQARAEGRQGRSA
jgi:transcriptional regulator with XRE-family HTH domain